MIKCVDLNGLGASIVIRCGGGSFDNPTVLHIKSTQGYNTINGTSDWKEYTISIDNVDPEVNNIIVYLAYLYNTTGTVYFDDIHLTYR